MGMEQESLQKLSNSEFIEQRPDLFSFSPRSESKRSIAFGVIAPPIFAFVNVVTGEHSANCFAALPGMPAEEELRHGDQDEPVVLPIRS